MKKDSFGSRAKLQTKGGSYSIYRLETLKKAGIAPNLDTLPFSIRVVLEAILRNVDGELVSDDDVKNLAAWNAKAPKDIEVPFMPARVILQDFTGVPAVVDLASMRAAVKRLGHDPRKVNPLVPVDLVVDHSVQVDYYGTAGALKQNAELEFQRNNERYEFLRWGQKAFDNFRVVPPATGIVHQVNLEYLAKAVLTKSEGGDTLAFPDTLVGTDSHTTMINGLGVLGWGVGGIEAEAAMLGQPLYMVTPQVIGMKLTGEEVDLVERYMKEQGLFRTKDSAEPVFTDSIELDLGSVEPSLAGPKRPQDRVALTAMKDSFRKSLTAPVKDRGFGLVEGDLARTASVDMNGVTSTIGHGAVTIAAITSCTNTSNPSVMLGAALVAKKAVEKGLNVKPYVKTSLAPGSKVVTEYLNKSGLMGHMEAIGFNVVGYGCTTCIGNSGPLPPAVSKAVNDGKLVASAVLSGNRNFEGRVNPDVKANYLASPPLVVAYALAGTTDIDFATEPIGKDKSGAPVMLKDIWPTMKEVADAEASVTGELFSKSYADVFGGNPDWNAIKVAEGALFDFKDASTYIQEPPFFQGLSMEPAPVKGIENARVLAIFSDSITTDHISPAGDIAAKSPAGDFLKERGVEKKDFNSYGARRGNDRIMVRGTFANIRLKNLMVPGVEGGVTCFQPGGAQMSIYDAAMKYKEAGTPLVILAGKEYGSGSSRDWAAKGTLLLGVRAVIAESFERIHRSNLVGMGVLPIVFKDGQNAESLGLKGDESLSIGGLDAGSLVPRQTLKITATRTDGTLFTFEATCRLDTAVEINYYKNGGILQTVLRKMLA
jgi:aconitate hydratase